MWQGALSSGKHSIIVQIRRGSTTTHSTTVRRINFEDKKFRGFRGYLLNLEIKYPRKFPA